MQTIHNSESIENVVSFGGVKHIEHRLRKMMSIEALKAKLRCVEMTITDIDPKTWPKYKDPPPIWKVAHFWAYSKVSGRLSYGFNAAPPFKPEHIRHILYMDFELRARNFLEAMFPHLITAVRISPNDAMGAPNISVWVRRDWGYGPRDVEYLGSVSGKGSRKRLAELEKVAEAATQEGMFLCTNCTIIKPMAELEEQVFGSRYCKQCYATNPRAKRDVDASRRPGFYN